MKKGSIYMNHDGTGIPFRVLPCNFAVGDIEIITFGEDHRPEGYAYLTKMEGLELAHALIDYYLKYDEYDA